ncbi:hypothetical protein M405DRAFT_936063, partial [Rhizopogon salebrosus TDB-379]
MAGNRIHETLLDRANSELLSILWCTPRALKELHRTQAILVDEVRIQPSMKISKAKSSLRRPCFPFACIARQEHRDA